MSGGGAGSTPYYANNITVTGGTPYTVTHNLGVASPYGVIVQCKDHTTNAQVQVGVQTYTTNTVAISTATTETFDCVVR
jgi:hypothetical protein